MNILSGKYSPFELNSILLDSRTSFKSLVPMDFKKSSMLWCFYLPLKYLIINLILTIKRVPIKYIFAHPNRYRDFYDNSILFFILSKNNINALSRIMDIVGKKKENVKILDKGLYYEYFPVFRILLVSLISIPSFWVNICRYSRSDRRVVLYNIGQYVVSPGIVWFYKKILKHSRPQCVVLSNDHYYLTKSLELVCEEYGVITIYVQHASVSYAFPELHFTYSFLDGKDAWIKYTDGDKRAYGISVLLGAIRYDNLSSYRVTRKDIHRNCIGVAVNMLDDNMIVNDLCNNILQHYPTVTLKIRSHPRMKHHPFVFDNKDRIQTTCAADESIVEYIDSIDFQIAGDSGVHFDALIGGVPSVAYNFTKSSYADNYGYVKLGLVKEASSIVDLFAICDILGKETIDTSLVRLYDESYGKKYAGHCSDIVAQFILNDLKLDMLIKNYGLEPCRSEKGQYYIIPE